MDARRLIPEFLHHVTVFFLIGCYRYKTLGPSKRQRFVVNGLQSGLVQFPESSQFVERVIAAPFLKKGSNIIQIVGYEGWIQIANIRLSSPEFGGVNYNVPFTDCMTTVCKKRRKILKWLDSIKGQYIVAGQEERPDSDAIQRMTGDWPVIMGLDFIHYQPTRPDGYGSVEQAIQWSTVMGGLVEFCWHWYSPTDALGSDPFYSSQSAFDLPRALNNPKSNQYQQILAHIDVVIRQLKRLQEKNIVILFRPLHEAQGGWFWWGKFGPDAYVRLYKLVYSRITAAGLQNIIWVFNSMAWTRASVDKWNPGRSFYDIISTDIYFNTDGAAPADGNGLYGNLVQESKGSALVALAENGKLPDIDHAFNNGAPWLYFKTWFGMLQDTSINRREDVLKTFRHPRVITLQEYKKRMNDFKCDRC